MAEQKTKEEKQEEKEIKEEVETLKINIDEEFNINEQFGE